MDGLCVAYKVFILLLFLFQKKYQSNYTTTDLEQWREIITLPKMQLECGVDIEFFLPADELNNQKLKEEAIKRVHNQ